MFKKFALASALAGFATAGIAASVTIDTYSSALYDGYVSGLTSSVVEDFEGMTVESAEMGEVSSAVGTFDTVMGGGSGSSVVGSGMDLTVRTQGTNGFGRTNTTAGGEFYLDSNDTQGIAFSASTGQMFDQVAFTLSDAADTGGILEVLVNDAVVATLSDLANANVFFVVIDLETAVASADIVLRNTERLNDGFAIDDVVVGLAAIPLPASGLLLIGALGAFAWRRRRD